MRLVGLLLQILAAVGACAVLGWWLARGLMRAGLLFLERSRTLRRGRLGAYALVLAGCAAAAAAVTLLAAVGLYLLLVALPAWVGLERHWIAGAWRALVWLGAGLVAAAGAASALREAWNAYGAEQRRRHLLRTPVLPAPVRPAAVMPGGAAVQPPGGPAGRAIVVLCDGTGNRPDQMEEGEAAATNVYKLSRLLAADEAQTVWYQAGVGSDTSSTAGEVRRTQAILDFVGAKTASWAAVLGDRAVKLVEGAFGSGVREGVANGYAEIVGQYRPGDRIYLVGFSRGAYTARCIAGVIAHCGLLRAENLRYAPDMVSLYRNRRSQHEDLTVRPDLVHPDPAVEFVGVFDTVASLGVPLWGWWFVAFPIWRDELSTEPVKVCRHVYQALAMDERRSQFFPTLYSRPAAPRDGDKLETLVQAWFRGAHADIGGGYARTELSDVTLSWMVQAMGRHGLRFREGAHATLRPDPMGRLHDELERKPSWALFGTWPRWHPVPGPAPEPLPGSAPDPVGPMLHGGVPDGGVLHGGVLHRSVLHPSVLERAAAVQERTGRPDLLCLEPGEALDFVVEARCTWDRTGIVIAQGGLYRLTYAGGQWRDGELTPCGPAGQEAGPGFDPRRWLDWSKRLRGQPWMRLVATVAHPRPWPLRERPWRELARLLFTNDPPELTRQLAEIGQDLAAPGASILLRNEALGGLLHLFANDAWQTATNNSGGLQLRIERLAPAEADGAASPLWTLTPLPRNEWQRTLPAGSA